jgi:hypothetical protein
MQLREIEHQGQHSFEITTEKAVYIYQSEAGGFSGIIDRRGNDWISFKAGKAESPRAAAGMFRGLPNFVFPDNIGHPGYRHCRSEADADEDRIVITTESGNGDWAWECSFHEDRAEIDMKSVPASRTYWFLYEGTIGGTYEPEQWFWGTESGRMFGRDYPGESLRETSVLKKPGWIYFGHEDADDILFCARKAEGQEPCTLYFMGDSGGGADDRDGMVVFGFGRNSGTGSEFRSPQGFVIGFMEKANHADIKTEIVRKIMDPPL